MKKELIKLNKIAQKDVLQKDININDLKEYEKKKYGNLAFGQLMTLSNNMIDFRLSPEEVYKIIEPKIKFYELSEDLITSIKCVLNINNEGKQENDNILEKLKDDKGFKNEIGFEESKRNNNNDKDNNGKNEKNK